MILSFSLNSHQTGICILLPTPPNVHLHKRSSSNHHQTVTTRKKLLRDEHYLLLGKPRRIFGYLKAYCGCGGPCNCTTIFPLNLFYLIMRRNNEIYYLCDNLLWTDEKINYVFISFVFLRFLSSSAAL